MNTNVYANIANQIVLTKQSTENEIKAYFQKVLELKQSNEEFPINLDEVWMLVYAQKDKATRALKKDFIENEDFITVTQNGEQDSWGGNNRIDYKLSLSCLEYFIARKVRPVFEVYRKVFHKAVGQKSLTPAEALLQNVQILVEQERRISNVEQKVKEIEAKATTRPDFFTIAGYASLQGIQAGIKLASSLGRKASNICKERGIQTETIPDPRFGEVKTYPRIILEEVFALPIN